MPTLEARAGYRGCGKIKLNLLILMFLQLKAIVGTGRLERQEAKGCENEIVIMKR